MLQDRSKRIALSNGRIERFVLVTSRELGLTIVALLILLMLVFPDKKLFEELLQKTPDDALSIAYLENLLRSDQKNVDWRLLLAGAQVKYISFNQLETLLKPVWQTGSDTQIARALQIRLQGIAVAYQRGTVLLSEDEINKLLHLTLQQSNTINMLLLLADNAILLDHSEIVRSAFRKLSQLSPSNYLKYLNDAAEHSLGVGRYRLAADLYFLARETAPRPQARRYFRKAIGALMADNRYSEVLRDAEHYLGDLKDDAETLRLLIRTSRAADSSSRAAHYARMLLKLEKM